MHVRILPDFAILETDDLESVMSRAAYLKLAYAIAYAFWLMYIVDKFFVVPMTTHSRPAVVCLLLFGTLPALGYVLLGKTLIRKS